MKKKLNKNFISSTFHKANGRFFSSLELYNSGINAVSRKKLISLGILEVSKDVFGIDIYKVSIDDI